MVQWVVLVVLIPGKSQVRFQVQRFEMKGLSVRKGHQGNKYVSSNTQELFTSKKEEPKDKK